MVRSLAVAALFLTGLFGLVDCNSGGGCGPGDHCACSGGDQCYLGCNGDNCDQSCSNMNRCGTVCGNGCSSTCEHLGTECSQACGANCVLSCASMPTCGVICGDNCQLDCQDVSQCAARVGAGSVVTCTSVESCTVECTGTCAVHCMNNNCQITCADGTAAAQCEAGRYACGGC